MKTILNINKDWMIFQSSMDASYDEVIQEKVAEDKFHVELPCDVHIPLIEAGIIKDPVEGDYSGDCRWIEDKAWWFHRKIVISQDMFMEHMNIVLQLDKVDIDGKIYINGRYIGQQRSVHYPFSKDIKQFLEIGENWITVRVTTGYEDIKDTRVEEIEDYIIACGNRGDSRRAFSRKPQYSCGWDWMERILTCGLNGDASLILEKEASIDQISISTKNLLPKSSQKTAKADILLKVRVDNHELVATKAVQAIIEILLENNVVASSKQSMIIRAGYNYIEESLHMEDARLWWPNGYGDQALYSVSVKIIESGRVLDYQTSSFGVRTIELKQDSIDEENRQFTFAVNGVDIFAKGSNWVPSDGIYARVSDQKYRTLIEEAAYQNNNMLRVWGGGIYEKDIFYDLCDQYGILIWHDFMYACSVYPEYEDWFMIESKKEATYQTRRLVNHPSMALWCGNNEMHWIYGEEEDYKLSEKEMKRTLNQIYNYMLPEIVSQNVEDGIYWNSSPYGGQVASSENMGDNHIWPNWRYEHTEYESYDLYDKRETKFMSEYGYLGPCKLDSVKAYCDSEVIDYKEGMYKYHSHFFDKDYKDNMVYKAIMKQYGVSQSLSLEEYLLLGGTAQGRLLEYSLEAYRSRTVCSGALLWMYNDAWGEEGWTTIDYYLNRKISFHYVRRALQPVKLIMKILNGNICLIGINETSEDYSMNCEIGFTTFTGSKEYESKPICLPKRSRMILKKFPYTSKIGQGVYYVKPIDQDKIDWTYLTDFYFADVELPEAKLDFEWQEPVDNGSVIGIFSSTFAHAVHFNLPAHIRTSDEYFDMLPGERREILIESKDPHVLGQVKLQTCCQAVNPEKL